MAKELEYATTPAPKPTARDELEDLIETMSSSGVLRALNGLVGQFDKVSEVALDEANTPGGRNILGTVLVLGECLARMPAEKLKRLSSGLEKGIGRAAEILDEDPPSAFQLLRMTHDPDARRAVGAVLAILGSIGGELSKEEGRDRKTG